MNFEEQILEQLQELRQDMKRMDELLRGGPTAGLTVEVDRLKQAEEKRVYHYRALLAGFLAIAGERLHELWTHLTSKS